MPSYTIDPQRSKLTVFARSGVHDTEIVWKGFSGTIEADPDELKASTMTISVDMKTGDAGDWLKNRKMRKDMNFDKHPSASFRVDAISAVTQDDSDLKATVEGSLTWRGKTVSVTASSHGTLTDGELVATGTFPLDMTKLGITPPKVLMIKVKDVVDCTVQLHARAT